MSVAEVIGLVAGMITILVAVLRGNSVLRKTMDEKFDGVDKKFDAVDKRFETVGKRFDAVDKRFETVDKRFDGVDKRFDAVDARLDGMDRRMDSMEARTDKNFEGVWARFDAANARIDGVFYALLQFQNELVKRSDNLRTELGAQINDLRKEFTRRFDLIDSRLNAGAPTIDYNGGGPAPVAREA
ncbi:hypothetical protein ACI1US_00571 [Leucobacter sp. BZR 635]